MSSYVPPHRRNAGANIHTSKQERTEQSGRRGNGGDQHEISRNKSGTITSKSETKDDKPVEAPAEVPSEVSATVSAIMNHEPEVKDEWAKERALFKKLRGIRVEHVKKDREKEYSHWVNYYDEQLRMMYDRCVPPSLLIPYGRFVRLAHTCSRTQIDQNTSKRVHVLQ